MTIQELREKRAKVWDTAREFLDTKRNKKVVQVFLNFIK